MDSGLTQALKITGSAAELARRIGLTRQAVSGWNRIPAERLFDVARATGLPPEVLRPDLIGRWRAGRTAA